MDVASSIAAVFAAVGLSAAAGLNAWLPLLMGAVLERLDGVELGDPFGSLSSNGGIAILAVLLVADLVGDKVPGLDHLLHLGGGVIAPGSGALLFIGQTGIETHIPAAVAAVLGAATAGTLHAGRASLRPASTASTAGFGNPVLSLGEDVTALTLTILAFAIPVLALLLALALLAAVVSAAGRLRSRRRPSSRDL
jgi:hypothetical protein